MLIENNKNKEETSTLQQLIQKQIVHEFENERLYLSMAIWCESKGFVETAKFFSIHALEERRHGMDFINAMLKLRLTVETPYTTDIKRNFEDLKDVLVQALKREELTSKMILKVHSEALEETSLLLEVTGKYIKEQVEEEELFRSVLNLYNISAGNKLDFEMAIGGIKSCGKYKIGSL